MATTAPAAPTASGDAAERAVPPVPGDVVEPFDPPEHPYGPGHRGVKLTAAPGAAVRTARAGTVAFAGPVAGTPWVSVDHRGGLRTSYGPVEPVAPVGTEVATGQVIGRLADGAEALHWGARVHGVYVDPMALLQRWRPVLRSPPP